MIIEKYLKTGMLVTLLFLLFHMVHRDQIIYETAVPPTYKAGSERFYAAVEIEPLEERIYWHTLIEIKDTIYSEIEIHILYRIVEAECTGQSEAGKLAVANVILNRMKAEQFPDSIQAVVFEKGQFSPVFDGRYYKVQIQSTTIAAVDRALEGKDNSNGALYFCNQADVRNLKTKNWFERLQELFTLDGHTFYK